MGIRERRIRRSDNGLLLGAVSLLAAALAGGCAHLDFESVAQSSQRTTRVHAVAAVPAAPPFSPQDLELPRDITPDQALRMELSEVYGPEPFALDTPPWFYVETVAYTPEDPEPVESEPVQMDGSVRVTPRRADLGEIRATVSGSAPKGSPLPEEQTTVISAFGMRGLLGGGLLRKHNGIDLKAPQGTPVRSTGAGVVRFCGRQRGYGNIVIIDHGKGYETAYAHLAACRVQEGARVREGDVIGTLGSTGRASTPHLHYEVRRKNNPVDPTPYLPASLSQ